MGRLQDTQYSSFKTKKDTKLEDKRRRDKEKLEAAFCPPLDNALIEAIWNDSYDYSTSLSILKELAREAEAALDQGALDTSTDTQDTSSSSGHSSQLLGGSNSSVADEDEGIDFLMRCFPTTDKRQLLKVLRAQDHDLEKATDILLNNIYLEEDQQKFDDENGPTLPESGSWTTPNPYKKAKKKKKKKKATVWTSGQLPTAMHNHGNDPDYYDDDDEEYNHELATLPFNYWHQYDDRIDIIHKVFPSVSKSIILGCVQRSRGNVTASVREVMEREPKANYIFDWKQLVELDDIQKRLTELLVDRSKDEVHRIALGVVVNELWRQQTAPEGKNSTLEQLVTEGFDFALHYDKEQQELAERLEKMALLSAQKAAASADMPIVPEYLLLDNKQNYIEEDPAACRDMAYALMMERNELFRKAAAAYKQARNKGPGEGGIAFYYSDEARQLDKKAREWNMRAARALVRQQRLRHNDDHLLDLHGLTVAEAQVLLKEGVTQWWSRSQMQSARRQLRPLKIITGVGNHSEHGQSKLLPSALKWLKREGWRFEIGNPGCILVKGIAQPG